MFISCFRPGTESGPVTSFTVNPKSRLGVIGIGNFLQFSGMAGFASGWGTDIFLAVMPGMTGFAISDGMNPGQGKALLGMY